MDDTILELRNVFYSYDNAESLVLKDISLKIARNQYIAVIGPNGSGKSTLAKIFNGILRPLSGTVYLDGKDIWTKGTIDKSLRKEIGIVFQSPDNQIVATTVEEDVAFGLENFGVSPREMRERIDDVLHRVGLYHLQAAEPHHLSGGQKQRLAIAGILAMKPKIIVFDEATAMLDPIGKKEILQTIHHLRKDDGVTILNITHSMEEAALSDRIIVLDKGEVILDDSPQMVYHHRSLLKEIGLEIPIASELAYRLRENGYSIDSNILNNEELLKELWKLL